MLRFEGKYTYIKLPNKLKSERKEKNFLTKENNYYSNNFIIPFLYEQMAQQA